MAFQLRPYRDDDEDAAIALWLETWQKAYPDIDFNARLIWWRERWRGELVPNANIVVAEQAGSLIGFVTIDLDGYLDQLVVAPEQWGSELGNRLVAEAKRLSPDRITLLVNSDNARAMHTPNLCTGDATVRHRLGKHSQTLRAGDHHMAVAARIYSMSGDPDRRFALAGGRSNDVL